MRHRPAFAFVVCALAAGASSAQIPALADPSIPMVPAAKPPLGAASRAARHEYLSLERSQRIAEQAEDRADTRKKLKARSRLDEPPRRDKGDKS